MIGGAKEFDREIGEMIRLYRASKGLSQDDLARQLGLTSSQIDRYEDGSNRLSVMRFWTVMALLDQNPSRVLERLGKRLSLDHDPTPAAEGAGLRYMASTRGRQLVSSLEQCDRPEVLDALADLIMAISGCPDVSKTRPASHQDQPDLEGDAR